MKNEITDSGAIRLMSAILSAVRYDIIHLNQSKRDYQSAVRFLRSKHYERLSMGIDGEMVLKECLKQRKAYQAQRAKHMKRIKDQEVK